MTLLLGLLAVACTSKGIPGGSGPDQGVPPLLDAAAPGPDLAVPADLAPGPDLAVPADLAPPRLDNVPTGCPAGATGSDVFNIIQANCGGSYCHAPGAADMAAPADAGAGFDMALRYSYWFVAKVADLQTQLVNQTASESRLPRIAPNDVDRSYVLYKLLGEQFRAGAGASMPPALPPIPNDQICTIVSWINAGAK